MKVEAPQGNDSSAAPETTETAERCTRCGAIIRAESPEDLPRAYTEHVVDEHGAPEAGRFA